ncbi:hypothetical protein BGX34_002995 [Mortierella sp. NVP85]|nr:hypothetical protein BGX34_002995 [Mortierella sp. NVP85]
MPALSDKIFLPTTIFVISVVLAVFRFVLVSAVGACFAIYAKYGGEYAKSVGWIQSSGHREMVKTILSTYRRKSVPVSVKWALIVALLATLVANFLDMGISRFINPALRASLPEPRIEESVQFRPRLFKSFYGWNFFVPVNGSAVETMEAALSSPVVIPGLDDRQRYTPITSTYNPACTDFGITFWDKTARKDTNGCGTVTLEFGDKDADKPSYNVSRITERSPNRWSILFASQLEMEEKDKRGLFMLDGKLNVMYQVPASEKRPTDSLCTLQENYRLITGDSEGGGFRAPSGTATTKCFFNDIKSMDIAAITLTSIRFYRRDVSDGDLYQAEFIRNNFIDESDDLFLTMQETVGAIEQVPFETMPTSPTHNSTVNIYVDIWAELRAANSTIDVYVCGIKYRKTHRHSHCFYGSIRVLPCKLPDNRSILKFRNATRYTHEEKSNYMNLEYLSNNDHGTFTPISIKKMRNDTITVTDYMAQLGYNYYAEFSALGEQQGKIYIEYQVRTIRLGLEVPLWVLVVTGIIIVISFFVWQLTDWLVGQPYSSSVYTILQERLASYTNTPTPKLMRFRFEPLMFEDVKLFPEEMRALPDGSRSLLEEDNLLLK